MNIDQPHWYEWLSECVDDKRACKRAGLGPSSLPALTGQDKRALAAVAACWQLYASSDEYGADAALRSISHLLNGMQSSAWHVARALIAFAMDWSDVEPLWERVEAITCITDPAALAAALRKLNENPLELAAALKRLALHEDERAKRG